MSDQTLQDAVVDDDPEYADDAAADEDQEVFGFAPSDPATIPQDEGDAGQAYAERQL
jgi:hypothetical protein